MYRQGHENDIEHGVPATFFFPFLQHMLTHTEHLQCLSNYATHLGKTKEIQCTLRSNTQVHIYFLH